MIYGDFLSIPLILVITLQNRKTRSGSIQIHRAIAVYILFSYSNITYIGSYLEPIFLWLLTQIYPGISMPWALAGVPMSPALSISSDFWIKLAISSIQSNSLY
jgi:hypothetical protein